MTQEDKELLLKDLCARLPYGVKCHYKYYDFFGGREQLISEDNTIITSVNITLGNPIKVDGHYVEVEYATPYLRPMSSMTEEECIELGNIKAIIENISEVIPNVPYYIEVAYSEQIDWLNAHHFDYRGLIEKGLALEAPEGMYK